METLEPDVALVHGLLRRDRSDAPVLVVGDDPAAVRLLKRFLKRAGYSAVATAADAPSAVRSHIELRTEIILIDVGMQDPDAFEVMERLQSATPVAAYPPIFVMTGHLSASIREEALAAGAKGLFAQPLDYSEVVVCMDNLLETRALHLDVSEFTRGMSNLVSVIRNYAEFVVSGIDERTQRGETGWSEIRRDAEEIRLAAERSTAFTNRVRSLRGDEERRTRRSRARATVQ